MKKIALLGVLLGGLALSFVSGCQQEASRPPQQPAPASAPSPTASPQQPANLPPPSY